MTRQAIRDYILRRVWVDDPATAPSRILADIATAVNAALQILHLAPSGKFFCSVDRTVTVTGGTNSVAVPTTVQVVIGCRDADNEPLAPVFSLDDIRYYRRRYEGATQESTGTPAAFFIETRRNEGDDTAAATLFVAPTPSGSTTLTLETRGEAPGYTAADLDDDANVIGIAHQYVESLFLPVAVYEATRFEWYEGGTALRESLREAASAAMRSQGLASPWPDTEKAKEAAA